MICVSLFLLRERSEFPVLLRARIRATGVNRLAVVFNGSLPGRDYDPQPLMTLDCCTLQTYFRQFRQLYSALTVKNVQ